MASILVTCQDKKYISTYQRIGSELRAAGLNVDVYLNKKTKLSKQLDYANKKGFRYVIIANKFELVDNKVIVRDMTSSEQKEVLISDLVEYFTSERIKISLQKLISIIVIQINIGVHYNRESTTKTVLSTANQRNFVDF